jgi:nucleotide-binding universal stress UspA family protein
MLALKTILHPTDFSERARHAMHLACALARDHGAKLVLCHVKLPPAVVYGEFGALPPEAPDSLESLRRALDEVAPAEPALVAERVVVEGDPVAEIVRLARERGADLIVMGTHGRTGLGRLLMGSVAEQVLRKAPCPVLTLKAPVPAAEAAETAAREPAAVW